MAPFIRALLAWSWSWLSLFPSQEGLQKTTSPSPSPKQGGPFWAYHSLSPSPSHPYGIYDDDLSGYSIFRRDSCGDAFGPGAANSQCAPSITLCCVRTDDAYPSCQQHLNKGWCCIGNNATDNCYVDQASACDEPGAVPCTDLAAGTARACCPPLTTCAANFAAGSVVRCNIHYGALIGAAASASLSSSTSSTAVASTGGTSTSASASITTGSTSTATSTSTSTTPPPLPTATSTATADHHPSTALIAGIAVGSCAGLALLAAALTWFLMWRKKQKQKQKQNLSQYAAAAAAAAANNPLAYRDFGPGPFEKSSSPTMTGVLPVEIGSSASGTGTRAVELPTSRPATTRFELGVPSPRMGS
ncbi:hypothetical protein VTN02DRAFT_628 [Thermoascus thermophilus]